MMTVDVLVIGAGPAGLAAAMIASEAAVEKTERGHDLERIPLLKTRHRKTAGHAFGPLVEVVLCVCHDHGSAGRS